MSVCSTGRIVEKQNTSKRYYIRGKIQFHFPKLFFHISLIRHTLNELTRALLLVEGHRNDPPYYDPTMNGISNKMGASGIYLYEVTSLLLRILMQHDPLSVLYTHITTLPLNINRHGDYRYTQRCGRGVLDI